MRTIINNKRKSISYFQSMSRDDDAALNASIFTEDVHRGVMPISGESRKHPEFAATIEGDEASRSQAIALLRSFDEYEQYDIRDLICDAVNDIALNLSGRGWQVYEITRDTDSPHKILIVPFTTKRLFKIVGHYIQCIPKAERSRINKRFIHLPSEDVWGIRMPSVLDGARGYKKIIKKLKKFHKPSPDFWLTDMAAQRQASGFNFEQYVLNKAIRDARVTRKWGWNQRDTSLKNTTEFYYYYRTITFEWAQAVMREHIIIELNILLARLKIDARIIVSGLPTQQDILRVRQELRDGNVQFEEAYNRAAL